MKSTEDSRTQNNVVRHEYRVLTDAEKVEIGTIKDMGRDFIERLEQLGGSRELSLARTNMEQAVMWAVKHLTA